MRISVLVLAVAVCLATVFVAIQGGRTETNTGTSATAASSNAPVPPADDRLVVHEWGTFTTFSGSDGARLEFRPLIENDLPGFVINRPVQEGIISPFGKSNYRVYARMETPVTYFYTNHEREVSVRVSFPQGLLTEFYPPVQQMLPPFKPGNKEPLVNSVLDWGTVRLIPTDRLRTNIADRGVAEAVNERLLGALLPASGDDHYRFARDTDSALVHVRRPADVKRPYAPRGDFFEKFLFYRGLGNFSLPLHVQARGDGQFDVQNAGQDAVRSLFLVSVEGNSLRFSFADKLDAGGRLTMAQSPATVTMDELVEAVVRALVAERLYEKEARAMVNTWRASWFGEQGTRLFYLVPSRLTDELLPLTITPKPDELVRVLVGRLEVMSPEEETRITDLVRRSVLYRAAAAEKAQKDPEAAKAGYPLPKGIRRLGRLAEPALVRVKIINTDAALRHEATLLLSQLLAEPTATEAGQTAK